MATLGKPFCKLCALIATLGFAVGATAQEFSAEFSPNPAPPGAQVTFTVTDATGQGLILPSPCFVTIHRGTQDGPIVGLSVACPQVLVPVPPNGSYSFTWDQRDENGKLVPPGRYWFAAQQAIDFGEDDFFCLSIQGPEEPALTAKVAAEVGRTTALMINSPNDAGALYLAALSMSSNSPLSVFGLDTCLSPPIFISPLVRPIGFLGSSGQANLAVRIPKIPGLSFQGFHVQALIIGNGRAWRLTNGLSFSIRPT